MITLKVELSKECKDLKNVIHDIDEMKKLNKLIRDGQESSEIWFKKGKIFEQHQKYGDAVKSFKKALSLDDTFNEAQNELNELNKKLISENLMPKVKKVLSQYIYEQLLISYDYFIKNYLQELEWYENNIVIVPFPNYGIHKFRKYKDILSKTLSLVRNNATMNFDQLILILADKNCIINQEQHELVWDLLINELNENLKKFTMLYEIFCSDFQGFYDPGSFESLSKQVSDEFNHLLLVYNSN